MQIKGGFSLNGFEGEENTEVLEQSGSQYSKGPRQVGRGPRKSAGSFAGQAPPSGCDDVAALVKVSRRDWV